MGFRNECSLVPNMVGPHEIVQNVTYPCEQRKFCNEYFGKIIPSHEQEFTCAFPLTMPQLGTSIECGLEITLFILLPSVDEIDASPIQNPQDYLLLLDHR